MRITAPRILALAAVAAAGWAATAVANETPSQAGASGQIGDVPAIAVTAYVEAARLAPTGCGIKPSLIAAIGAVESGHGTFGDSQPDPATGDISPPIRGPQLNGVEFALIRDTDDGVLDGDQAYDRAVGPMQFIPATWAFYADPGDDPQNIIDSAKNTARLLCAVSEEEGRPITDLAVERAAILSYNYSTEYVATVRDFAADFEALGINNATTTGGGGSIGGITAGAVIAKLGETGRARWADLGAAIDRRDADRVRPVYDAADPLARALWNTMDVKPGDVFAAKDATVVKAAAPSGRIVTVKGIEVDESIADQLERLLADAAKDGIVLHGSGWRSYEEQVYLRQQHCGTSDYEVYVMPSGQCSPPTAIPGTSNHETGLAIDFRDGSDYSLTAGSPGFVWLSEHAAAYGLYNLPSEPWHWSTTGN